LTEYTPYSGCSDTVTLLKIQAGEMPQRPSDGITDPVWEFLERCWSRDPTKRPPIAEVYGFFSQLRSNPQVTYPTEGRSAMEELPGRLKVQAQSIKISLSRPKRQRFYLKYRYGNKDHTTSPTTKSVAGSEHTWFAFRRFLPSLPLLSLGQGRSRNLVDRNQQTPSWTDGLSGSAPPGI